MPIVRSGETDHDKEMARWDLPKRMGGYGPDGFEPYPRMLYKAHRRDNGKVMCMDMSALYGEDMATVARAEAFNASCQKVVQSEDQYLIAKGQGWCDTPTAALEAFEQQQQALAQAAAEVNYQVRRMSEAAQREHAEADAATDAVLADGVPVPKRKPGRPKVAA